jgi:peptide/nickel transport system substrate-binding protein
VTSDKSGAGAEATFTRRRFGQLSASAMAGVGLSGLLAACGSGETAAPARGGTLIFGSGEPPTGEWDPAQNFGTTDIQVASLVFDSLVRYDAKGQIVPGLATEWRRLDDRRLDLKLRTDVKWHDGTPFTAEDVKATIERVANDPKIAHHIFWSPATVRVNGPDSVTIVTKRPFAPLEKVLAVTNIVSAAQLQDLDGLKKKPVGTGYFKFDGFDGSTVRLTANKAYWDGAPKLAGVQFKIIPDRGALMSALADGGVHITYRLSPADLRTIQGRGEVKVTAFPALDNIFLGFNTRKKGLDDARVRQAIAYAIDRPGIVKLFGEYSQVSTSPLPIGAPGFTALPQYDHDPARARQLLSAAGVSGLTVTMPTATGIWPFEQQVDEIISQSLERVGIKTDVTRLDAGKYRSDYAKYDVFVQSWYMLTGDPDFTFTFTAPPLGELVLGWKDEKFAGLFTAQRETVDQDARQQRIDAASKYLWDQLPLLPLQNPKWLVAYRKEVVGYQHGPTFAELLHGVSLSA